MFTIITAISVAINIAILVVNVMTSAIAAPESATAPVSATASS